VARGLEHIGVIRCLEGRGFEIAYIAGSSIDAPIEFGYQRTSEMLDGAEFES
jgi:predicted acylesterase/phospholipase RssA